MNFEYRSYSKLVVCVPANTHTFFMLKIEQTAKSTLSTNYYCLSVLTSLSSEFRLCCSNCCCNIMFFSFSSMYLSTKCRIKSQLFKFSPPFRPLERASLSTYVRLIIILLYLLSKIKHILKKKKKNVLQYFCSKTSKHFTIISKFYSTKKYGKMMVFNRYKIP